MIVKQLYTNCLSEAAYFVASDNEAIVIDPMRDIDEYLALAQEHDVKIKYIFETHFHADFISGHLELAEKTDASIVFGPNTQTSFPIHVAKDGEKFNIGKLTLEVIHTPGHTLESSSYLLTDEAQKPHCIFTGDTLFVGDVGRPDLSSGNLSQEELAAYLFDSIQKLKKLPDSLIVYPAHGSGSACGKSMSEETASTIGMQKKLNYAMQKKDKKEFIKAVTEGLSEPPSYFKEDARINKEGYDNLDKVIAKSNHPLSIEDFKKEHENGAWILDTRSAEVFSEGFVPDSINIGLQGRFAEWAGQLLPMDQPIILVTDAEKEQETIVRLARIGLHQVVGYLKDGFQKWKEAGNKIDLLINVSVEELMLDIPFDKNLKIWDVRKPSEFKEGHVEKSINIPLNTMMNPITLSSIEEHDNLYIHCQSGYRSSIACSLIKRQGFQNIRNIPAGFAGIRGSKDVEIIAEESVEV
ncbi:MAG TPA: MBL fold metallo-hydrolase [Chitinophagaceae bacterium]|nr:MBL fold metallo-hydrolase [Chitinophagaceae bacterium]